jgi:hypothetical protein
MIKRFSVSLEELYKATKAACRDLGAKIVMNEVGEDGGMVEAHRSTGRQIYLIFFKKENDSITMTVVPGTRTGNTVMASAKKSDFDKFWAALDAHL